MKNSIDDFIKKYELDNFKKPLELTPQNKIEFFNDLTEILIKLQIFHLFVVYYY